MHLFELVLNIENDPTLQYEPHKIFQNKSIMESVDCEIPFSYIKGFHGRTERYHNDMCWIEFVESESVNHFYFYATLMKLSDLQNIINCLNDKKQYKLFLKFKRKYFHIEYKEV